VPPVRGTRCRHARHGLAPAPVISPSCAGPAFTPARLCATAGSPVSGSGEPIHVGDIVAAVDVGRSTVSAHLKVPAEVRFVLVERRGTAAHYRINDTCVACFPSAADVVMGRPGDGLRSPWPAGAGT
jgi:DNA-binding transcriptional ArsR family regulator